MSLKQMVRYFSLCALLLLSSIAFAEKITHTVSPDGKTEVWLINEPDVGQDVARFAFKPHADIRFQPGDGITIEAGGCVQTGGTGKTWKRYVDPRGPNSDKYYYGTIWIPGVLGAQTPNVARIKDVLGKRWGVPPSAKPAQLYLLLGYLDDDNSDNGYYSHDDGTDDQCKGTDNAWVRITAVRGVGGALWASEGKLAPNDLLSDGLDDNLIPLNPYWSFMTNGVPPSDANPAKAPSGDTTCVGNGIVALIKYTPDTPPCVSNTTITSRDDANTWKTILNNYDPFQGPYAYCSHANWGLATYSGTMAFESHSDPFDDDDYSWQLRRTDKRGLAGDRDNIEPEFNSEETMNYFSSPWWADFRDAVNSNPDDGPFTAAKNYFGSKFVILTGLFGLDLGHYPFHSELHPVFAMAVRVKEDDPSDEHWAIFVRRFGDEGFCSSQQHYLDFLPDNKFVFKLPLLWGPKAVLDDNVTMDMRAEHNVGDTPKVEFVAGDGVYMTFDLPEDPAARQLVHGELHLKWNSVIFSAGGKRAVAGALASKSITPSTAVGKAKVGVLTGIHAVQSPQALEDETGPEGAYRRIVKAMTAQERQALISRAAAPAVTPSAVVLPKTVKVIRLTSRPKLRVAVRRPSVRSVPDPAKMARDQQKQELIRTVIKRIGLVKH